MFKVFYTRFELSPLKPKMSKTKSTQNLLIVQNSLKALKRLKQPEKSKMTKKSKTARFSSQISTCRKRLKYPNI